FTEEHLSTENELVRNILLAVLASLAELERKKISERTKAGLERARAKGKILGRPKFSDGDREKLRRALDVGESWHAVSRKTRIPYATVKKHARAMGYEPRQRVGKPTAASPKEIKTNFSGLPTLGEVLAQLRAG
ncbi:MAG TPA: recombinase family protein, partial [Stellaceae bacterium]|nr:recombinase family protein [Stellaceae bacterium]